MSEGNARLRVLRLGLALAVCVLALGFGMRPGVTAEQGEDELVPGLDLWSETRRTPPYWTRDATPDLLPRAERHRTVRRAGVPIEYRSRRNPYPQAQIAIDNGGRIYGRRCAPCNGAKGGGNGVAGQDLTPSPAFLAYLIKGPHAVDEYLLWTISEGGEPFDSEMPAFKDSLAEEEIWQIITYMRADFPAVDNTESK